MTTSLTLVTPPTHEPLVVSEVMSFCGIDESNQEPPPSAITVALGVGSGSVTAGVHRYLATFVTSTGETQAGEISEPVTVVNGIVSLSNIAIGGADTIARKLYRTQAGGSNYLHLTTLLDNTTEVYSDSIADAALGAEAPSVNTTGDSELMMSIKAARIKAEDMTRRVFITQTWDMRLDGFQGWELTIPLPKLQSITEIEYLDTNGVLQILDPSLYVVDSSSTPARITPAWGKVWPVTRWQMNAVRIRFVAGYGTAADVPDTIKLWMKLRIKHYYDNRGIVAVDHKGVLSELPRMLIDGLLDGEVVNDYSWAHE